jgi:hypothetical protein
MIATRLDEIVRNYMHELGAFGKSSAPGVPAAKRRSPRCARGWRKSSVGAKRPNASVTTYVENC